MRISILVPFLIFSSCVLAQHGIAPKGYYPPQYRGDTFTGTVAKVDGDNDILSLEYRKSTKIEVMEVKLEDGCSVPSKSGEPMRARNVPVGTVLTAYYVGDSKKGQQRTYTAVAISFVEWQGKRVDQSAAKIYLCGKEEGNLYFRAFGPGAGAALSPMDIVIPRRKRP